MIYPKRIQWQGGTTAHGQRPQPLRPVMTGPAQTSSTHQSWHDRQRASWLAQAR